MIFQIITAYSFFSIIEPKNTCHVFYFTPIAEQLVNEDIAGCRYNLPLYRCKYPAAHTYTHTYIYTYVCVCVQLLKSGINQLSDTKRIVLLDKHSDSERANSERVLSLCIGTILGESEGGMILTIILITSKANKI